MHVPPWKKTHVLFLGLITLSSQPPSTPAPEDPTPSSRLSRHCTTHTHTQAHRQDIPKGPAVVLLSQEKQTAIQMNYSVNGGGRK